MPAIGKPSNNPKGRPTERAQAKGRTQISLSPEAKAILASRDNPIKVAGWRSLSQLAEAMLRGEVEVPKPSE